jgi:cell division transport system permease protein
LKKKEFIEDVVYDKEEVLFILNSIFYIEIFMYVFALVAILVTFYLIVSVNNLVMSTRKKTLDIMKLFGAKLGFIRLPLIFNGVILGILAVIWGTIFWLFVSIVLKKFASSFMFTNRIYLIIAVYSLSSLLLGFAGGIISARKINLKFEKY